MAMMNRLIKTNNPLPCALAVLMFVALSGAWIPPSSCAPPKPAAESGKTDVKFEISTPAFQHGQTIPKQYTGDGKDISPPFKWTGRPDKTQTFALICDDPDAPVGTWDHWVLYDLPATVGELKEALSRDNQFPDGSKQGNNSWGKIGYGGPAPPRGKLHRYFFKLYALDKQLGLKPGATKQQVLDAMKGHTLAESETMGTYQR